MVAESVRAMASKDFRDLNADRVKPTTYKIYTCHYLTWRLASLGEGKDSLAQCQDIVTVRDNRKWWW